MGSWGSKPNKKNESNNLLKNNVPKKPKYNFFSKPPNFWFVFNFGLSRNRKTGNTGDKNLMTRYKIFNEDLDKDNLAQVFISKIMKEQDTEEQIKVLYDLGWRLKEIRGHEVSKNTQPEIKKAIEIIRDNYKKYEIQINKKIAELNAKKIANSTGTTTASANSAANSTGTTAAPANSAVNSTGATAAPAVNSAANSTGATAAPVNSAANSALTTTTTVNSTLPTKLSNKNNKKGGSRKKYKKSRS